MLAKTSVALNETVDQVRDLASNPQIHQNLLDVTKGLAQTATTIGAITADMRTVTGNPQTQAQLRDTIANTDAATQKLNSLLHSLGGSSNVYGVDAAATPAPAGTGVVPAVSGTPVPAANVQTLRSGIGAVARSLIAFQIRLSELDDEHPGTAGQPLLQTTQRGPQTDLNAVLLPKGKTSLLTGANDIGTPQSSWNVALRQSVAPHLWVGGGVLYSNLGALAQYEPGPVGFEARVYDPQYPTLDAYGDLNVAHGVQLFGGERDVTHTGRRTVFGLQLQF
jgi:hypothetical protein